MIDTSLQRVLFVNSGGFRLCDIDLVSQSICTEATGKDNNCQCIAICVY